MKNSSIYKLKNKATIHLRHIDCLKGLAELDDQSISAVVTSPPYNLGIKYNSYDDTIPRDEYLTWINVWTQSIKRVLEPGGSLFLNLGASPKDPWIPMDVARIVADHLTLQNTIHWIKSISIDREYIQKYSPGAATLSVGHYKPINSKRFINDCHEYVYHFTHHGEVQLERKAIGVPYQDKSNITRWQKAGSDKRCRGNNWFIPYETITSRVKDRPHPASFPGQLVENCLRLHGLQGIKQVIDPFMGIGTTALVCADLMLNCLGFELDEQYYSVSVERLRERLEQSKSTLF